MTLIEVIVCSLSCRRAPAGRESAVVARPAPPARTTVTFDVRRTKSARAPVSSFSWAQRGLIKIPLPEEESGDGRLS
ncbi:hypothetical protein EVAR_79550_1 [Eumeta japonica]|uniref:Uncharacterized protein n=1 Tax=Eumeta variegata TaxID=151549 RepID=A0A4C1UFL2_EUMVA|nr:hypothetical protein EVAR_79550_1 [Eumeta japonica]